MRPMLLVLLAAFTVGCSNAPSRGDCEKLLDKTLELDAAETGKPLDMKPQDRARFVDECVDELPSGRVSCALEAKTKQEMLACDG